ncbi:MAG: hypothetical protein ACFFCQ_17695, partial [Promethearchaeota archaeon]
VKLSPVQKKIFNDVTESLTNSLGISKLVVRGFYLQALKDWQKKIQQTVEETELVGKVSPEKRIQEQKEIMVYFRKRAVNFLKSIEKLYLLEDAVSKAVKLYTDKYASR